MHYRTPILAALFLGAATFGQAQGIGLGAGELPASERYVVRVEYRQSLPTLEGKISNADGTEAGTLLDLKDDLGLDDVNTYEIHGVLQLREGHKFRGSYTPIEYNELAGHRAARTFNFDDTRFDRDALLATNMKGNLYYGAYEWDFVKGEKGYLGAIAGGRMLDIDTLIVAPEQGKREQENRQSVVPVLGAAMRLYQGRMSLDGELTGFSFGTKGHSWDASGGVKLHVSDRIAVGAGYKYLSFKSDDDENEIEYRTSGWQFGLELSL